MTDKLSLTPEEIQKIVWLEEEVKAGNVLVAELTDKCRDLEAQLAKAHRNRPEWRSKVGDLINECVNRDSFTPVDLKQILALCEEIRKDERERIAKICNHAHTKDGYSVDWERLKEYEKAVFLNDADQIIALFDEQFRPDYLDFNAGVEAGRTLEKERIRKGLDKCFAGRLKSEMMAAGRVCEYVDSALKEKE